MSYHQPSEAFNQAATYLSQSSSLAGVSTNVKLELYGLYKYVTVALSPTTSRPSVFDMTGRAKWEAWVQVGKRFSLPGDAERRYIEIARNLGWRENVPQVTGRSEETEENIWDDDSDDGVVPSSSSTSSTSASGGGGGSGGGLSVSVSAIAKPAEVVDRSLHGLVLQGDLEGLDALLANEPNLDLDKRDEYGYGPIHLACDRGKLQVVEWLLKHGADKTLEDPDGYTPLQLAQEVNRLDIAALLQV